MPKRPHVDTGVPAHRELFAVKSDAQDLQPFIQIKAPETPRDTPPVLAFQRKREVDIPWKDILGNLVTRGTTSIAAIREYFEYGWGLVEGISKEALTRLTTGPDPDIRQIGATLGTGDGEASVPPVFGADLTASESPPSIDKGFVLRHGISGRLYLVVENPGQALTADDFQTPAAYKKAWNDKIDGVDLVFASADEARDNVTDFEEIDLRPAIIHRAFTELLLQREFAREVSGKTAEATETAIAQIIQSGMDTEELERLQSRAFQLRMQEYEVQRQLERLVSRASDLGYYLFLETRQFKFPDKPDEDKEVKPGEIYRQYRRTARWTTSHSRNVRQQTRWLGIFPRSRTVKVKYKRQHARVVADYSRVDTSRDPLADAQARHRQEGMQVFLFQRGPDGFVTADGTSLGSVMDTCDRSEDFRRRCVIMLPVYEESLTGDSVLAKYSVFIRPLPGIAPTTLPRLVLNEALSYRTAWKESRIGELVSTVNLAPGEKRTVVVTKTFEQETTVSKSSSSIFDISRMDSNDLASEMENQVRSESEKSSNLRFETSASGSYGFITAEASAGGGTSTSLKDFSQAVSRVAKKAAQSVNQQNREEVTSSSSSRTAVANKDETTATLHNINAGRTLNLLFYRVYNKYIGGIFLDELQFEVIPGSEIIAGSGVFESRRFGLTDLPAMLDEFQSSRLPFDLPEQARNAYLERVMATIESLLEQEYAAEPAPAATGKGAAQRRPTAVAAATRPRSVQRLCFQSPEGPMAGSMAAPARRKVAKSALEDQIRAMHLHLASAVIDQEDPIVADDLLVASGGLYLDTAVGAQPSTEPYSEAMRREEVRMRAAEVYATEAGATYQMAMAARLAEAPGTSGNWLTGMLPNPKHNQLMLSLKHPLPPGDWALMVNARERSRVAQEMIGKYSINFAWEKAQNWLSRDNLLEHIALVESKTGSLITKLPH